MFSLQFVGTRLPNTGADEGSNADCLEFDVFAISGFSTEVWRCQMQELLEDSISIVHNLNYFSFYTAFWRCQMQELIEEPVVAADGHTYERRAIEDWFTRKHTSPMLNTPLESTVLFPNHSVRSAVQKLKERQAAGLLSQ